MIVCKAKQTQVNLSYKFLTLEIDILAMVYGSMV